MACSSCAQNCSGNGCSCGQCSCTSCGCAKTRVCSVPVNEANCGGSSCNCGSGCACKPGECKC